MDLETALSRPVQLDRGEGILFEALLRRRAELRRSWRHLIPTECLESLGALAPQVESFLSGRNSSCDWRSAANFTWIDCDAGFLDCLSGVALGSKIKYRPSDTLTARLLPVDLNKLPSNERFNALCDRYHCPLNIGLASEHDVAEELLRQLMVSDRAKLEAEADFYVDLVLLKLNLVGIRALITRDLRSLDALNYFYELPKRSLTRLQASPRFLAFWLCIYAQLLGTPEW